MSQFIVSYSRQDEAAAARLAADIESLGHTAWVDKQLSGGQAWWDRILERVRQCDAFVFALTPAGLESTACRREWSYAAALGKPILPVLVEDGVRESLLPRDLAAIQWVDYRTREPEAVLSLARAIGQLPPPRALPDPLPEPPPAPLSYLGGLAEQIHGDADLGRAEQATLLLELKRAVSSPETAADGRRLLRELRQRRDLLATSAEEIDELLRAHPAAPAEAPGGKQPGARAEGVAQAVAVASAAPEIAVQPEAGSAPTVESSREAVAVADADELGQLAGLDRSVLALRLGVASVAMPLGNFLTLPSGATALLFALLGLVLGVTAWRLAARQLAAPGGRESDLERATTARRLGIAGALLAPTAGPALLFLRYSCRCSWMGF